MIVDRFRCVLVFLCSLPLLAFSCAEAEFESPTYEFGETGILVVRNPSRIPMAIGGCNPTLYQERLPGRWIPDGLIRPRCVFSTDPNGNHTLSRYQFLPARGSVRVVFPTDWLGSQPGIMRVLQRVSVGCEEPESPGAEILCRGVESITTEPIVVFEAGTTDTVGRS